MKQYMKCENCKHIGELIPQSVLINGYDAKYCRIHNGLATRRDARACWWCNKDVQTISTNTNGTIKEQERVVIWQGKHFEHIAYMIAKMRDKWFCGVSVNVTIGGGSWLPNLHDKSAFDTEQEAREYALRECERLAAAYGNKTHVRMCQEARMKNRQLTLF